VHHLADHGGLLGIFLAEIGARRLEHVEQLGDDRRNTLEMAGPCGPFQHLGGPFNIHIGLIAGRVDDLLRRRPYQIDSLGLQQRAVLVEQTR